MFDAALGRLAESATKPGDTLVDLLDNGRMQSLSPLGPLNHTVVMTTVSALISATTTIIRDDGVECFWMDAGEIRAKSGIWTVLDGSIRLDS